MTFHAVAVGFRNAVEQMLIRHGRPDDLEHMWWGFGPYERSWPPGPRRGDDDGLAGSRVPRRPHGGTDAARVELEEPVNLTEVGDSVGTQLS
jgi:hypothetical protein